MSRIGKSPALMLGALDQAVLGLGTIVLFIVVARSSSSGVLGSFAVALSVSQIVTVVIRSLSGEALQLIAPTDGDDRHSETKDCLTFTMYLALVFAAVGAAVLWTSPMPAANLSAWAMIAAPGICVQDSLRYAFFRTGAMGKAFVADLIVNTLQIVGALLILKLGLSASMLVIGYGLPPLAFSLISFWYLKLFPSNQRTKRWRKTSRHLADAFAVDAVVGAVSQLLLTYSVAWLASLEDAAAYRSIVTIFGATNVLLSFMRSTVLSVLVEKRRGSHFSMPKVATAMISLVVVVVIVTAGILAILPQQFGHMLLGETWEIARPFILVGAIARVATGVSVVPGVLLKSLEVTWSAVNVRAAFAAFTVITVPISIVISGVNGAFVSQAVIALALTAAQFVVLFLKLQRRTQDGSQPSATLGAAN